MAQGVCSLPHPHRRCRGLFGPPSRSAYVSAYVSARVSADASRNCLISLNCVDVLAASQGGARMSVPSPKICRRIRQFFRSIGDPNANAAATAREKLVKLLADHGLTWNDIHDCITAADEDDRVKQARQRPPAQAPHGPPGPSADPLEIVLHLVERHVAITPEERMLVALWILHTYVFDRFNKTPRLALLSPVRRCGKTTLLTLLEALTENPDRNDNVSAASIYYDLERGSRTLLLDEADNLGLLHDSTLRTVLNGNQRGCYIKRYINGRPRKYSTFTPLAIAAIGMLPLPLLDRSVIINMQRSPTSMARLDERDPVFAATRAEVAKWAATCKLNPEPDMLPLLRNRAADNCRVLFSIADDLGCGEAARAAATALFANRPDEDVGVLLLIDIRRIFLTWEIDRIATVALIKALLALDDGLWADWRGPNDDRPPRKLNQYDLSRQLRPFNIRPRTVRFSDGTSRGYLRAWFESAWAAYCPPSDTSTQSSKVIHLAQARSDT
jgi:hypothetical protein